MDTIIKYGLSGKDDKICMFCQRENHKDNTICWYCKYPFSTFSKLKET